MAQPGPHVIEKELRPLTRIGHRWTDVKSLTAFAAPHSFTLIHSYDLPRWGAGASFDSPDTSYQLMGADTCQDLPISPTVTYKQCK